MIFTYPGYPCSKPLLSLWRLPLTNRHDCKRRRYAFYGLHAKTLQEYGGSSESLAMGNTTCVSAAHLCMVPEPVLAAMTIS